MANPGLKTTTLTDESGTVRRRPNRIANDKLRGREYLTESEVSRLEKAALKSNRHGFRDATMIMTSFRHGLTCPNCDSPAVVFHKGKKDRAVVRCGGCGTLLATRDQFRRLLERHAVQSRLVTIGC